MCGICWIILPLSRRKSDSLPIFFKLTKDLGRGSPRDRHGAGDCFLLTDHSQINGWFFTDHPPARGWVSSLSGKPTQPLKPQYVVVMSGIIIDIYA
jgi:hypothetical protein